MGKIEDMEDRMDKLENAIYSLGLRKCNGCSEWNNDTKIIYFKGRDTTKLLCRHCRDYEIKYNGAY